MGQVIQVQEGQYNAKVFDGPGCGASIALAYCWAWGALWGYPGRIVVLRMLNLTPTKQTGQSRAAAVSHRREHKAVVRP